MNVPQAADVQDGLLNRLKLASLCDYKPNRRFPGLFHQVREIRYLPAPPLRQRSYEFQFERAFVHLLRPRKQVNGGAGILPLDSPKWDSLTDQHGAWRHDHDI